MRFKMKKYMIVAAALFLTAATPTELKAQWDGAQTNSAEWTAEPPKMPNTGSERSPFKDINTSPPSYVPPGGDGNKIVPISGGIWIVTGLSVAYGIVRRKFRREEDALLN